MKAASKNNFYQQAIDELYRSAHTSNGMHRFVDFLRTHLPIDAFSLDILDSSNNAMENLIFIVQPETFPPYFSGSKYCSSISGIEPLSSVSTASPAVDIDSEDIDGTLYSSILMSLPFENGNSLRIKLYARGEQRYSNKHASQLLSLHYPLATAVGIMVKQSQLISNSRLDSSSGSSAPPIETKHIIGRDRGLKTVMDAINVVRRTDSSVLLMGETGTGKILSPVLFITVQAVAQAPLSRSTAEQSLSNWSTANYLAMKKALLRVQFSKNLDDSREQMAERCFWMRLVSSPLKHRFACCGRYRTGRLNGLEELGPFP
ncbi:MAG: hypothetical protein DRR06_18080 [Gammaproteobacteria bacterium]|nr:MAG: hypothetical protein DRR06_18080 [Gammaproteobacteria bacterium]